MEQRYGNLQASALQTCDLRDVPRDFGRGQLEQSPSASLKLSNILVVRWCVGGSGVMVVWCNGRDVFWWGATGKRCRLWLGKSLAEVVSDILNFSAPPHLIINLRHRTVSFDCPQKLLRLLIMNGVGGIPPQLKIFPAIRPLVCSQSIIFILLHAAQGIWQQWWAFPGISKFPSPSDTPLQTHAVSCRQSRASFPFSPIPGPPLMALTWTTCVLFAEAWPHLGALY